MSKILIANWTWYPSGGDWTYIDNVCRFYESKGHEVVPFSMKDERNFKTPFDKYFVSNIDYKDLNKKKNPLSALKVLKNSLYSAEAKRNIRSLLSEHKIDLVHLNNIHHYLTPGSIIPEIKRHNIPIIWTVHDYSILCPNTTFISHDKVCERCKVDKYYNCIVHKCKKGSLLASSVAAMESYVNKWVDPYKYVDYFLCPSQFIADKFIQFGYDKKKIVRLYNPFDISSLENITQNGSEGKSYIVYVGNILKVKGVFTLAEAVKGLDVDLYIIGDGEAMPELEIFVKRNSITNVYFLGRKKKQETLSYVKGAKFVVVPSEWYENLPYSLVEALLLAKPVLGARIGGIPELVLDNETGFLFESANKEDMIAKMKHLLSLPAEKLSRLGNNAQKHVAALTNYRSFENNLSGIFESVNVPL
jgi:glycosyltransferase involved in cell wall biosynthesis